VHYANGRPAANGDKIVRIGNGYSPTISGILYDAQPGNDACNGRIALFGPNDPMPNLAECLHEDDAKEALNCAPKK
jgi:hypothetical protein